MTFKGNVVPNKNPTGLFVKLDNESTVYKKTQKDKHNQHNFEKQGMYFRWYQDRDTDVWVNKQKSGTEHSPETGPHTYGYLAFKRGSTGDWQKKDGTYNKWYWNK